MRVFMALCLLMAFSSISFAETPYYQLKTLSPKSYDSIRIIMNEGTIQIAGTENAITSLRVRAKTDIEAAEFFDILTEGNSLVLRAKETVTQPIDVVIQGAAIPLNIHAKTANVVVKSWAQPQTWVLQKGNFKSFDTRGELKIHDLYGNVDVNNHTGDLSIENFEGKIALNTINGNVKTESNMGSATYEGIVGNLQLTSQKSKIKVTGGSGALEFSLRQGGLQAVNFKGYIKGTSDQAPVSIRTVEEARVRVQSQSGAVDLFVPQKSAAGVAIQTVEGRVSLPKYLKVLNRGEGVQAYGHLKGSIPGRLHVSSQNGPIKLKVY